MAISNLLKNVGSAAYGAATGLPIVGGAVQGINALNTALKPKAPAISPLQTALNSQPMGTQTQSGVLAPPKTAAPPAVTQPATTGSTSTTQQSQGMTTPSGLSITGNPTSYSGTRGLLPPPTSFGGLVGTLADTSQRGSATGQQYTNAVADAARDTSAVDKANTDLENLRKGYAAATGKIETTQGLPLEFVQGREQVLGRQYASQESAAQQALNNALTARGQTISGLQQAGGLAYQGQGLQQQGLQQAAGLAQPQLGAYGQNYYQPLQAGQGGSSPYGTGPEAAANVSSIQDQTKLVNDWSASRQSAVNIGNQLTSFLSTHNVNPADFNQVNRFLQTLAGNTSSPEYKQFYNLVTDLANTYAPVLGQGDASNYKVQLAQSLLDGSASGKTLPQILQGLDQQAQAKILGVQQNIQNLQTGQNVNTPVQPQGGNNQGWGWQP